MANSHSTVLSSFQDMGVTENNARIALSSCEWDVTKATDRIFT